MAGNGDERQAAAWERGEAKLDRQGTRLGGIETRLGSVENTLLKLTERLETIDRKHDLRYTLLERKIDLLRLELLDELGTQTRMEAAGRQMPLIARIDAVEEQLAELRHRLELGE